MVETRGLFPVSQGHKNRKTVPTRRLQFSSFSPTLSDYRPTGFDCLNFFRPVRLYTFLENELSHFCVLVVTLSPMKGVECSTKIIVIYNPRLTRRCKRHDVPIMRLMHTCHDVIITHLIIHKLSVVWMDRHHNIILDTFLLPLFDSLTTSPMSSPPKL